MSCAIASQRQPAYWPLERWQFSRGKQLDYPCKGGLDEVDMDKMTLLPGNTAQTMAKQVKQC